MIIICNSFRFIPDDGEVIILLIITYPIYKGQQYFILWKLVREGVTGAHIRSREGQISNTLSATPFSINTPLFFCFWQKLLLCPHFPHQPPTHFLALLHQNHLIGLSIFIYPQFLSSRANLCSAQRHLIEEVLVKAEI